MPSTSWLARMVTAGGSGVSVLAGAGPLCDHATPTMAVSANIVAAAMTARYSPRMLPPKRLETHTTKPKRCDRFHGSAGRQVLAVKVPGGSGGRKHDRNPDIAADTRRIERYRV